MIQSGKINAKTIWAVIAVAGLFLITMQLKATTANKNIFYSFLTTLTDTIPARNNRSSRQKNNLSTKKNNLPADTTLKTKKDSIFVDTLHLSKDSLDAPVKYSADTAILIIPTKQFILIHKASVQYKDIVLDAGTVRFDQQTQLVQAYGGVSDTSTNDPLNKAKLSEGEMKSISDSILFSLKTLRGITKSTFYNEGELYMHAEVLKKVSPTEYYGYKGRFTTCNLDTPHFAIRARKMKMISNKLAVSGPASPEFEGVPIPIGIPFGIYPLTQGRHGGVLVPTFAQSQDFGLGLEGLGYYKVFNDYWDATARSNLYSYGGWSLNLNPRYTKRYRYTGNLNITFQNTKALNRSYVDYGSTTPATSDEFNVTKSFMLNWTHSQDSRSRPGTSFGANVNFGSTKYNQTVLNNPYINYQNQLTSSISYSKDFKGKANIALTANHNQNNALHLVNVNLPNLNGTVVTMFPFKRKDQVGQPKWYENLGIGYSGNLNNQFSFYDTAYSFKKMLDTVQWSASHSIPITLSLPAMGPVTLAPSVSFQEHWFGQQIFRKWDSTREKLDTSIKKGFYAARQMSFGISASTRIFGTYGLGTSKIRHEVRPTISVSYTPDMNSQNYYNVQVDTAGHTLRFSKFDGIPPGAFAEGAFGGISFGIDNLLEMKVKDKKDTAATATKKFKLLDGFGFSSSYNLLADSFALAPFSLYARSTLFNVINITSSATLDPYQIDKSGYRINKLAWNKGSLGRITNGSIALSTQFKSKPRDGRSDSTRTPADPFMTPDEQQRQLQYARANPAEYTDFNIPWTLSLSYSFSFSKQLQTDTTGAYSYQTITSSNINFNGDFSLTPKWKVGATGYLNVANGSLQQLSMFVTREMHCWQLAVNVNPIGIYRSFSITINPKSGILRDLRINRSRTFSNY